MFQFFRTFSDILWSEKEISQSFQIIARRSHQRYVSLFPVCFFFSVKYVNASSWSHHIISRRNNDIRAICSILTFVFLSFSIFFYRIQPNIVWHCSFMFGRSFQRADLWNLWVSRSSPYLPSFFSIWTVHLINFLLFLTHQSNLIFPPYQNQPESNSIEIWSKTMCNKSAVFIYLIHACTNVLSHFLIKSHPLLDFGYLEVLAWYRIFLKFVDYRYV